MFVVSEYIIVILHTINSFIAVHIALEKLSRKQLIISVKMINGNTCILLLKTFLICILSKNIINKFKIIKSNNKLLLGKKNILVLYVINNKNLITFFIINFSFQFRN